MDDVTIEAATAIWHADVGEAQRWFEMLGLATTAAPEAEAPDWGALRAAIVDRAGAEGFPAESVETFLEFVEARTGDPALVLTELADPGNTAALVDTYQAAVEAIGPEWDAAAPDVQGLGWLTAEQAATLDTLAPERGAWVDWLPAQLDEWWSDWRVASPDQLVPWLDEWLPALTPSDVRGLTWLSGEQVAALEALPDERGHWSAWLPSQLDEWWPDWSSAPADQLVPWLDEWLPTLTTSDARDLTWLTDAHLTALGTLGRARGEWSEWLPAQLDEWWPEWSSADAGTLGPWLTECLQGHADSDRDDEAGDESTAAPGEIEDGHAIATDVLTAVVSEAALDLDEFAELSDEEFADLLSTVLDNELEAQSTETEQ